MRLNKIALCLPLLAILAISGCKPINTNGEHNAPSPNLGDRPTQVVQSTGTDKAITYHMKTTCEGKPFPFEFSIRAYATARAGGPVILVDGHPVTWSYSQATNAAGTFTNIFTYDAAISGSSLVIEANTGHIVHGPCSATVTVEGRDVIHMGPDPITLGSSHINVRAHDTGTVTVAAGKLGALHIITTLILP